MKNVAAVISFVTLFAIFYAIAPFICVPDEVIFGMFLISPFLVLYMAYVILKHGKPSGYTFEDRYYDDLEEDDNGKIII